MTSVRSSEAPRNSARRPFPLDQQATGTGSGSSSDGSGGSGGSGGSTPTTPSSFTGSSGSDVTTYQPGVIQYDLGGGDDRLDMRTGMSAAMTVAGGDPDTTS